MRVCAGDGGRWGGLKRQKKKLLKTAMLDLKDSFGRKKKKNPAQPLAKYLTRVLASLLPFPYFIPGMKSFCLIFILFVSRTDLQSNTLCRGKLGPESLKKNVCTPLPPLPKS